MNLTNATSSTPRRRGALALAALSLGFGLALLSAHPASAASVINVTTTADDYMVNGNCSLREAIESYNTQNSVDACEKPSGATKIVLPVGTFALTQPATGEPSNVAGDLNVRPSLPGLTIDGAGMQASVIDAGLQYGIFSVDSPLTLEDLAVKNGKAGGGDISLNDPSASLELRRVLVDGNQGAMGAIFSYAGAPITIVDSRLHGNKKAAIGASGPFTLQRSTIDANGDGSFGGAAVKLSESAVGTIVNSTITNNLGKFPGAVEVRNNATLTVDSSTIVGNATSKGNPATIGTAGAATVTFTRSLLDGPCDGLMSDGGQNVVTAAASKCIDPAKSTIVSDLGIGALGMNSGLTPTMAVLEDSPATGAVTAGCLAEDQQGRARGSNCDAGAFESSRAGHGTPTTTVAPTTTAAPTTTTVAPTSVSTTAPMPVDISTPAVIVPPQAETALPPAETPVSTAATPTASSTPESPSDNGNRTLVFAAEFATTPTPNDAPAIASAAVTQGTSLAYTGASRSTGLTVLALGLVALGAVLIAASRRRQMN
jgi:CSLREA domain-containing protein